VIEKLDIEVDEYDFRNMFFGEVKVRTDEDYEMEEDFPAALSEALATRNTASRIVAASNSTRPGTGESGASDS
jgi:hypothetical protein